MEKLKTAEMRPLKEEVKSGSRSEGGWKQRPSPLAILNAVMMFVGGVGRVLQFIDKVWSLWSDNP